MKQRWLSLILVLSMLLSMLPVHTMAAPADAVSTGQSAEAFAGIGTRAATADHTAHEVLPANQDIGGTHDYYLKGDFNRGGMIIQANATIHLCLCGHTLNFQGGYMGIPNTATLVITDCSEEQTGRIELNYVENAGSLTIEGGTILGHSSVYNINNTGLLSLAGGTILYEDEYAYAVQNSARVTISKGSIENPNGKCLYNTSATATTIMTGGIISAKTYAVASYGQFVMEGGEVVSDAVGIWNIGEGTAHIKNGTVSSKGSFAAIENEGSLTIDGGKVQSKGNAVSNKGTMTVSGSGELNASNAGIAVSSGTVSLTGGTVSGGNYGVTLDGGIVNLKENGKITSTNANSYAVLNKAQFGMTGGQISGVWGGIYSSGTSNLHGGSIDVPGVGLYTTGGAAFLSKTAIYADYQAVRMNSGNVTLSGAPVLTVPENSADFYLEQNTYLTLANDFTGTGYSVQIATPLDPGEDILVAKNYTENVPGQYPFYNKDGYLVHFYAGDLYLRFTTYTITVMESEGGELKVTPQGNLPLDGIPFNHRVDLEAIPQDGYYLSGLTLIPDKYCEYISPGKYYLYMPDNDLTIQAVFAKSKTHGNHPVSKDYSGANVNFSNKLSATYPGGNLDTGNYYLVSDLSLTQDLIITGDVILCLNGLRIDLNSNSIQINEGASLKLCDCSSDHLGGRIVSYGTDPVFENSGELYIYGGTIFGIGYVLLNHASASAELLRGSLSGEHYEAAIHNEGTVLVDGASISCPTVNAAALYNTGTAELRSGTLSGQWNGVYSSGSSAKLTVKDGSISGSNAGVDLRGGTLFLSGGTLSSDDHGVYVAIGAQLHMSGAPVIEGSPYGADIYLENQVKIYMDGVLTGGSYSVRIHEPAAEQVLTSGWVDGSPIVFTMPEDPTLLKWSFKESGGEVVLTVPTYTISKSVGSGGSANIPSSAAAGSTVKITVNPNSRYTLKSVTVTPSCAVEYKSYGVYEFIMPEENVTVTIQFESDTHGNHGLSSGSDTVTFTAITDASSFQTDYITLPEEDGKSAILKGGSYALRTDISLPAPEKVSTTILTIAANSTVNLCLNGHAFNLNKYELRVPASSTLNICDCSTMQSGTFYSAANSAIDNRGVVNLYSGTVQSIQQYSAIINHSDGELYIYGGRVDASLSIAIDAVAGSDGITITGGTVIGATEGIYVRSNCSSDVTVKGGTITSRPLSNSSSTAKDVYGIHHLGSGQVNVSGGTVTSGNVFGVKNNTYGISCAGSGTVNISGSANILSGNVHGRSSLGYSVHLISTGTVNITGGNLHSGTAAGGNNTNTEADDTFTYAVSNASSKAKVIISGGTIQSGKASGEPGVHSYGVMNAGTLQVSGSATIQGGSRGISNTGTATFQSASVSTTVSDSTAIYNTGKFTVNSGTITASPENSNAIGNRLSGVTTVNGGTITGTGNGIFNMENGILYVHGGTITGTGKDSNGIGNGKETISPNASRVTVTGGTITGVDSGIYNESTYGDKTENGEHFCAVLVTGSNTVTATGGYAGLFTKAGVVTIENPNASYKGDSTGGFVDTNGTLIMHDGVVTPADSTKCVCALQNLGTTTVDGGKIFIVKDYSDGVNNSGKLYVGGDALITAEANTSNLSSGTGINNLREGYVHIYGGLTNAGLYGLNNSANGKVLITDGTVIGGSYGLYCTNQNAANKEAPDTELAYLTMEGGTVEGATNGVYLSAGTVQLTGGSVSGSLYGFYMDGGIFKLGQQPGISGNDMSYADIWFSKNCRTTIIDEILLDTGSPNPSWSVLTEVDPTLNVPVPFTHNWTKTATEEGNEDMPGEERDFRTAYFTSRFFDVQLYDTDGDNSPEVVLAICEEHSISTLTFYQWAGKGVNITEDVLFKAINKMVKREGSLMFNYVECDLTQDNVIDWIPCDYEGNFYNYMPYMYQAGDDPATTDVVEPKRLWVDYTEAGFYTAYIRVTYHITVTQEETRTVEAILPIVINVYDVEPSTFVLDFGLKMDLNQADRLFGNDVLSLGRTLDTAVYEDFCLKEPYYSEYENNFLTFSEPGTYDKLQFGTYEEQMDSSGLSYEILAPRTQDYKDDKAYGMTLHYVPGDFVSGPEIIYALVRAYDAQEEPSPIGQTDPLKEVEMYKKITVMPANVVYYEDDFFSVNYNELDDPNAVNVVHVYGGSHELFQDNDQSEEYGQDSHYSHLVEKTYENVGYAGYEGSANTFTVIEVKDFGEILSFDFIGTGFDVVGGTTIDSGSLIMEVYALNLDGTVAGLVIDNILDTVYMVPNGAIYQVPILHAEGLTYGRYRVKLYAVPKNNWSAPENEWENGVPPLKDSYLYIDGVRIYNPMYSGDPMREYYLEGEQTANFQQLRQMLLAGEAASARFDAEGKFYFGSGLVSYVEKAHSEGMWYTGNRVNSLNDYLTAGPNNEIYFNERAQSLVLYAKPNGAHPMLQVAIRNLNPQTFENFEGATDTEQGPGLLLLGVNEDGSATQYTIVDAAKEISYTEQYYTVDFTKCVKETIAGEEYYRVVLAASNAEAFALTNIKFNDLSFYQIPGSASDYRYDSNGKLIATDAPEGVTMPNLQELAWQLGALNATLPEDELQSDTALCFRSASLSLQSNIGMNFYVLKSALSDYTDPYVVFEKQVFSSNGSESWESCTVRNYENTSIGAGAGIVFHFNDLSAKEMGSTVRATLYAYKNGQLVKGECRSYSVLTYATNMLSSDSTLALKQLLVDMLNYGAVAQKYFNYRSNALVNATLTSAQQAWGSSSLKTLNVRKSNYDSSNPQLALSMKGAALSLEDKVELNFKIDPKSYNGSVEELYLAVTYQNALGQSVTVNIPGEDFSVSGSMWSVTFDALNATDMRSLCSVAVYRKLDETPHKERLSDILTYSIESYAASNQNSSYTLSGGTANLGQMVKAMMLYGDSVYAFFSDIKVVGSFVQPWLCFYWTEEDWDDEFRSMKEMGMEFMILQNAADWNLTPLGNQQHWENYKHEDLYSLYPTEVEFKLGNTVIEPRLSQVYVNNGDKLELRVVDQMELMLKAAKKHGMQVYIGLIGDIRWFRYGFEAMTSPAGSQQTYFQQWSEDNARIQVEMLQEIWDRYGKNYGDQIAGWYYHNEIWNINGSLAQMADKTHYEDSLASYSKGIADNLNTVLSAIDALDAVGGNKPLMISPYFNITLGTAAEYGQWWKDMFRTVNFREGDIFVPQDTVGLDGNAEIRIDQWIAALAAATTTEPGLRFWVNNEAFREDPVGERNPATVEDLAQQLRSSNIYSQFHVIFSWNHYYNPRVNPQFADLNEELKAFLTQ